MVWWRETDGQPLARIFGIRHLSPAAAHHLHQVLEEVRPTAVLVEGPADAEEHLPHLVHKDTRPPVALLAYTQERPVRSLLYPLAEYSPEWVALTWGLRRRVETRFIDLPAAVFLAWHTPASEPAAGDREPAGRPSASEHTRAYLDDPYEAIARLCGAPDPETWWERHFEHTAEPEAYARAIFALGRGLRELRSSRAQEEDLVREAYMRRVIHEVLAQGHDPERVLVVCGAFHAPALTRELPPLSEAEWQALPRLAIHLTLMPYSYYRLSSQSGYGAGNQAPAYYQRLYEEQRAGHPERLAARFLTELGHEMRRAGQVRSAAEIIEAVRLAQGLAALAGASAPCLRDLRDAAFTCLGRGDASSLRPFLMELEVGSAVGKLPKGVGQTALQDDFGLQLEELKLLKYQIDKTTELELDLRENRFVQSREAAFLDRRRSTFLHRLRLLGIAFATPVPARQDQATWKECWKLRWTPECEIQLVEAALWGDSVEEAASRRLAERLAACVQIDEAAQLVRQAADCQLSDALDSARRRLQELAVEDHSFLPLAEAVGQLAEVIRYGSVRQVDPEPLRPLLGQLFLRCTLLVQQACLCDRQTVPAVRRALLLLNQVCGEMSQEVDAERWQRELDAIAAADHLQPYLSGLACALALEKGRLREDELAREVSRRLSPGVDAELGAGWFEGLVQYNRMALFSRLALWQQLDQYVLSLDEAAFRRALVYLRRAFSDFAPGEIRRVVSNLVEATGEAAPALQASVETRLDEEELKRLQEQLGDLEGQ